MWADSYDADRISVVPEYQCGPHGVDYSMRCLGNLRIWREHHKDTQKLIAFPAHMLAWDTWFHFTPSSAIPSIWKSLS